MAAASTNQQPARAATRHSVRHIAAPSHAQRRAGTQPEDNGRPTAGQTQKNIYIYLDFRRRLVKLPTQVGLYAMALSFCLFVGLSPETRTCRALATWSSSSAIALAAVSGRSAAGPARPVPDILVAVGAYRVVHSGRTDLFVVKT